MLIMKPLQKTMTKGHHCSKKVQYASNPVKLEASILSINNAVFHLLYMNLVMCQGCSITLCCIRCVLLTAFGFCSHKVCLIRTYM